MSNIKDTYNGIKGSVLPYLVDASGKISLLPVKCNTILSSSRRILAHLMAGDMSYRPSHIIFLRLTNLTGNSQSSLTYRPIDPSFDYDKLIAGGSSALVPCLLAPSSDVMGTVQPAVNSGAVTFTSHTGLCYDYEAEPGGTFLRAILASYKDGKYIPFSAIDFGDNGITAGDNTYFGVYWTIIFGEKSEG